MATTAAKTPATRSNALEVFTWEGTDKRGVKMKGETSSKNANLLRAELRKQGINPTVVRTKSKPLFGAAGKSISAADISVFSRQIATMLQSGVPMVQSFEILASGQKNPRMRDMLVDIRDNIAGGSSLSEAMARHPVQFDALYRNLTRAGEGAGVLDTVLDTVATYKERTEALKGKIKKALFYPAAVIAVAILVSAILLIYVVPQFETVFKGFGADLPAFTQMIVDASRFLTAWWWLVLLVVAGSVAGFMFAYKRSQALERNVDKLMLKLPVIGQILHQSAIARFARTLALTFKAGVPLVEALETVGGATGSIVYNEAVNRIRDDVSVGYQLNVAMKQVNLFPHMVVQMTAIGEEAGALDTMLLKVAEFYEQEVNNSVDALASLIEPFIMVVIGILVGGMVIGMYLPIFKLAATVG
ncbi:type II secretion system F family protein [Arenimonas terrae]|jgi:type IV pilus assembly protein PilC|uniref:Type II secretion system F family protein n=1 Tax=Arenimonas terrae TaxID=2546226 RepID=A0A5C4RWS4_9GAMM|nr:type II secretion system F family protein [Arenimonas terrae]TNJ35504.1 type II secretion system F family protein [Arenimonas terrae]